MTDTTTELTVLDRATGELVDVRSATDERLAQLVGDMQELRGNLAGTEAAVSDELVRRLDMNGSWTLHIEDSERGCVWEVKTASPTAGTDTYPEVETETVLAGLIEAQVISEGAAGRALQRRVSVSLDVPFGADLDGIADNLRAASEITLSGVPVQVAEVAVTRRTVKAGINALRKIPGVGEALDGVQMILPSPHRRARVTQTRKGA